MLKLIGAGGLSMAEVAPDLEAVDALQLGTLVGLILAFFLVVVVIGAVMLAMQQNKKPDVRNAGNWGIAMAIIVVVVVAVLGGGIFVLANSGVSSFISG